MTRRRALLFAATGFAAALVWLRCGPLPAGLLVRARELSTLVEARDGAPLYESLSSDGARRRGVRAAGIPPVVAAATLAAEDVRFRWHPGVDPLAIARAAGHDLSARRFVEGGSTITEQAVKLLLPASPRTIGRKIREAVVALRLEHRLGKDEILALYLDLAPYGRLHAGIAGASDAYFGCPPANLTAAQAAFLAGLPQRPTGFDPYRSFALARGRQRRILLRMRRAGFLSANACRAALAERLALLPERHPFAAPHFVQHVRDLLPPGASEAVTTLDPELQKEVEGIIAHARESLSRHHAANAAALVLDNETGEWLAWEGSGDFRGASDGGQIDGALTPRQPGSALKPLLYAMAFDSGFTPASVLPDLPSSFPTADPGVLYMPRNYDGAFRGPLRARQALAGSENVPAVYVLSRVTPAALLRLLRRAGFSTLDRSADYYGLALAMGDAEVRLDELVAAYGALARGGLYRAPRAILRVRAAGGAWIEPSAAPEVRIVSPRAAYWIGSILSDADARAFAFGRNSALDFPFPVAVKTGTSQAYRDNWTIGFTRRVTAGVWVGNFDRRALADSSGVTGAAPILHAVLLAAEKRVAGTLPIGSTEPPVSEPEGLDRVEICALSGGRAGPFCPRRRVEELAPNEAPPLCSWHYASDGAPAVDWPGTYRGWASARGLLAPSRPSLAGPLRPASLRRRGAAAPEIENPPDGATYLLDPTLRREFQALRLTARAEAGAGTLAWSVDGRRVLGAGRAAEGPDWPLAPGAHLIEVTDAQGRSARARIFVK